MEDYYGILGIARGASEKDIKAAYLKLLRKHPPEKDPEGFKRIRQAYETLIDAKARAEYDAMSRYGDKINKLMELAELASDDKDYTKAIKYYEEILAIEPKLSRARHMLGWKLALNREYEKAVFQFRRLVNENPENASYMLSLGLGYKYAENYGMAESWLRRAYERDKLNADIAIELSKTLRRQRKYGEAKKFLREAINADGVVEFLDFVYFFELLEVCLVSGETEEAEGVIAEIKAITPDDPDDRIYVAWRFVKLAEDLRKAKIYYIYARLVGWAKEIDPENDDVQNRYEFSKIVEEYARIENDPAICDEVKMVAEYYLLSGLSDEERKRRPKEINERINQNFDRAGLLRSLQRIKYSYPKTYKANQKWFDGLINWLTPAPPSSSTKSSSGPSSSSCFVATAAFGTPWAAEIDVLRWWRDAVLQHDRIGRPLVCLYYRVGPYLAAVVRRSPALRGVVRAAIRRVIARVQMVYPGLGKDGATGDTEEAWGEQGRACLKQ